MHNVLSHIHSIDRKDTTSKMRAQICQQYPTRNDSDIQPKLQYNLESTGDIAETNKHDHDLNKSP